MKNRVKSPWNPHGFRLKIGRDSFFGRTLFPPIDAQWPGGLVGTLAAFSVFLTDPCCMGISWDFLGAY